MLLNYAFLPPGKNKCATLLSDSRDPRVFLQSILEIELCGNTCDEISVNGL